MSPNDAMLAELRALVDGGRLPRAMDYERAARELSLSVSGLRKLIRRGEIATVMIGRRPKVPASEVVRLTAVKELLPQKHAHVQHGRQRYDTKAEAAKVRALTRHRRTH